MDWEKELLRFCVSGACGGGGAAARAATALAWVASSLMSSSQVGLWARKLSVRMRQRVAPGLSSVNVRSNCDSLCGPSA